MMGGCTPLLVFIVVFVLGTNAVNAPNQNSYDDKSITVTWSPDLTAYTVAALEMSTSNTSNYREIYRGVALFYKATNLAPLTLYYFRLKWIGQATNSSYSPATMLSTSGTVVSYVGRSHYPLNGEDDGEYDGIGDQVQIIRPRGMAWNSATGDFFFTSVGALRKANAFGLVSTVTVDLPHLINDDWFVEGYSIMGLAVDTVHNALFLSDANAGGLYRISLEQPMTWVKLLTMGTPIPDSAYSTKSINGVKYDEKTDTLYFIENEDSLIRKWVHPATTPTSNIRTVLFVQGNLESHSLDLDGEGNIYASSSNYLYKVYPNATKVVFAGTGGTLYGDQVYDGANAKFALLEGVSIARDGSIYVVDYAGYSIRRISKEGITCTVAGRVQSPTVDFVPGSGNGAVFCGTFERGPAEILEHPKAPNFFYIADNCGIRILYGTVPPVPILKASMSTTYNSVVTIFWDPIVPAAALNSISYNVSYINLMGGKEMYSNTVAPSDFYASYYVTNLPIAPNTRLEVSILSSNNYGNGSAATQILTSNNGPRAPVALEFTDSSLLLSLDAAREYLLQMSASNSEYFTIHQGGAWDTVFNVTNLEPLTSYYFRVIWINQLDIYGNISCFSTSGAVVSFVESISEDITFNLARGMAWDHKKNALYVVDQSHVRKVDAFGAVTNLNIPAGFADLYGIALDLDNNKMFVSSRAGFIYSVSLLTGESRTLLANNSTITGYPLANGDIRHPAAMKYDPTSRTLYFVENNALRKWSQPTFTPTSTINTLVAKSADRPTSLSFDKDANGNYYFAIDSILYKIYPGIGENETLGIFTSLAGIAVDVDKAIYISDATRVIKRILPNGIVNTVVGAAKEGLNTFVAGTGSDVNFCGSPAEILAHPLATNAFFISDSCGVRFLYGSAPPPPTFTILSHNFTSISLHWSLAVPISTITKLTLHVSFLIPDSDTTHAIREEIQAPFPSTLNLAVTLPFNTSISLSMNLENKYGDSIDAVQSFVTGAYAIKIVVKNETRFGSNDGVITFENLPDFYQIKVDDKHDKEPGEFVFTGLGQGDHVYEVWHTLFGPIARGTVTIYQPPDCSEDNGGCDPVTKCSVSGWNVTCGPCPKGYTGSGYTQCDDVDECANGTHTCTEYARCTNTIGAFNCSCIEGFIGDGFLCQGIACSPECEKVNGPGTCCPDGCHVLGKDLPCRPSRGICDLEETCDGISAECPPDKTQDYSYVCRPANFTQLCDLPDVCGPSLKVGRYSCGEDIHISSTICDNNNPFKCGDHVCYVAAQEENCKKCNADCGICANQFPESLDCTKHNRSNYNGPNCDIEMVRFNFTFKDNFEVSLTSKADSGLSSPLIDFKQITLQAFDDRVGLSDTKHAVVFTDCDCDAMECSTGTWCTGQLIPPFGGAFVRAKVDTVPKVNKVLFSIQVFNWRFPEDPTGSMLRVSLPMDASDYYPRDDCDNTVKSEYGDLYMLYYNGKYGILAEYPITLTIDSEGLDWNFTRGEDGTLFFELPYFLSYASFETEISLVKRDASYCRTPMSTFSVGAIILGVAISVMGVVLLVVFLKNCKNMKYQQMELDILVKAVKTKTAAKEYEPTKEAELEQLFGDDNGSDSVESKPDPQVLDFTNNERPE